MQPVWFVIINSTHNRLSSTSLAPHFHFCSGEVTFKSCHRKDWSLCGAANSSFQLISYFFFLLCASTTFWWLENEYGCLILLLIFVETALVVCLILIPQISGRFDLHVQRQWKIKWKIIPHFLVDLLDVLQVEALIGQTPSWSRSWQPSIARIVILWWNFI